MTIDNQTAEWLRSAAALLQKSESDFLSDWLRSLAVLPQESEGDVGLSQEKTDDVLSLETRQKQIRQIFARNEW